VVKGECSMGVVCPRRIWKRG